MPTHAAHWLLLSPANVEALAVLGLLGRWSAVTCLAAIASGPGPARGNARSCVGHFIEASVRVNVFAWDLLGTCQGRARSVLYTTIDLPGTWYNLAGTCWAHDLLTKLNITIL